LLRKSSRGNTHDEDAIFDEFHAAVFAERALHHRRPQLARSIDETQIDAP
jgi:hypothetical protein